MTSKKLKKSKTTWLGRGLLKLIFGKALKLAPDDAAVRSEIDGMLRAKSRLETMLTHWCKRNPNDYKCRDGKPRQELLNTPKWRFKEESQTTKNVTTKSSNSISFTRLDEILEKQRRRNEEMKRKLDSGEIAQEIAQRILNRKLKNKNNNDKKE